MNAGGTADSLLAHGERVRVLCLIFGHAGRERPSSTSSRRDKSPAVLVRYAVIRRGLRVRVGFAQVSLRPPCAPERPIRGIDAGCPSVYCHSLRRWIFETPLTMLSGRSWSDSP